MEYTNCTYENGFIEFHFRDTLFTYWVSEGALRGDGLMDWLNHLRQKNWFSFRAREDFIDIARPLL